MISFCLGFAFCCLCVCLSFCLCLRAWHLHKVEKVDPVNVVKTQKKINAAQRLKKEQQIEELLNRG